MGTSSGTQTTQQNSQTQPWQPAIPALTNILGNVQNLQGQSGINPTENAAIQQLTTNAGGLQNFAPQTQQQASAYLGGDPYNLINPAYQNLQSSLSGLANPNNLNPMNTPGFGSALNTLNQDITNQINGQFAAAGRSGSGMNDQTLARGLSQGEGQLIANQYNQNVSNLQNAAQSLYGGGIGANQAIGQNVLAGLGLAGASPTLATQGPSALLSAGQTPFNLLAGNQGTLAGLATPIAGLGGQSQGQSQTNTSYSPSLLGQIGYGSQIAPGLINGAGSALGQAGSAIGGILSGLGSLF